MYEVVRTVSLVLMWVAFTTNVWSFFRCERTRKKLKECCLVMQKLIEEWEEKHNELKVEESEGEGEN